MIQAEPKRDVTLFARIQTINKEMIKKYAEAANMDEAPFVDRLLTVLRTTTEGKKIMALDTESVGDAGNKVKLRKKS